MSRSSCNKRVGLTLIEMLVVLAILGVMAGVALQMTGQFVEQRRFEATQQTLAEIRDAALGAEASGSSGLPCFLVDTGRLPASLEELTTNVNNLPPFALVPAPAPHESVLIPVGWRGPYVRLPIGSTSLTDSWGRPFEITPHALTGTLAQITSLGADGLPQAQGGVEEYNRDITLELTDNLLHGALITGKVFRQSGDDQLPPNTTPTLTLYRADVAGTTHHGISVQAITLETSSTGELTYKIPQPPVGPQVLCAASGNAMVGAPRWLLVRPGETLVVDVRVE